MVLFNVLSHRPRCQGKCHRSRPLWPVCYIEVRLKAHLYWQSLLPTYLGFLGWCNTNRIGSIDIKSLNRLLKVCYVPATSAILIAYFSAFLLQPLTVLMKQTRQPVRAVKQSLYLDVYDWFYLVRCYPRWPRYSTDCCASLPLAYLR